MVSGMLNHCCSFGIQDTLAVRLLAIRDRFEVDGIVRAGLRRVRDVEASIINGLHGRTEAGESYRRPPSNAIILSSIMCD